MREEKQRVRNEVRAARTTIPAEERAAAADAVAERLLAMPEFADVHTVLAYAATSEELDPAPTIEALRRRGVRVAYPRVCAPGAMTIHWSQPGELRPGYCGLLEPREDAEPAEPADIDLVLVPGVAFDAQCHRLGMGSGFYDRFLAKLRPGAHVIGIAFEAQMVERVPCEAHDAQLDAVVTQSGTYRASGA